MKRDGILRKIRSCLALGKSPNEHESAAALRQAQALMRKHGVELHEVDDSSAFRVTMPDVAPVNSKWPRVLCGILEDVFGVAVVCEWSFRGPDNKHVVFGAVRFEPFVLDLILLGPRHRVQVAQWTAEYVIQAMGAALDKARSDQDLPFEIRNRLHYNRDDMETFCAAWLIGVHKQIEEKMAPTRAESDSINNLMMKEFGELPVSIQNNVTGNAAVGRTAQAAAEGFSIYAPVEGGGPRKPLGKEEV